MRTTARETLFKLIYSKQFNGEGGEELKSALFKNDKLTGDDSEYCNRILALVEEHEAELTALIDEHSVAFPEKRIFPSDRSILLIAISEILYCKDIPDKVSMNEAANIASKYSSAKSANFITGILSAIEGGKNV